MLLFTLLSLTHPSLSQDRLIGIESQSNTTYTSKISQAPIETTMKLQYRGKLNIQCQASNGGPRKTMFHNNFLWLTSYDDNAVYKLHPETGNMIEKIQFPQLQHPRGMDVHGDRIYVACYGKDTSKDNKGWFDGVVCFDAKDTTKIITAFEVPRPRGLVCHNGEVFVTLVMANQIQVFSLDGEYRRTLGKGILREPRGIAVLPNGRLVVADCGNNRVAWLNPENGKMVRQNAVSRPNDVCTYMDNIFVSQWFEKCVRIFDETKGGFGDAYKANEETGFFAMISANQNRVLVADDTQGIVRVFDIKDFIDKRL